MAESLSLDQKAKVLKPRVATLYKDLQAIHVDAKLAEADHKNFKSFRGKYKRIEIVYTEFMNSWDSLYEIYVIQEKEKEFPYEEKFRTTAKAYLQDCDAIYETIMNPVPSEPQPSLNTATIFDASASTNARSRLPKINIPTFYGDILKWPQFRDVFLSMVHNEAALDPIEKFHYLVGSLSGEPSQLVSSFSITAANYQAAWDALNKRFNNKRVLAAAYMQRIRAFKPVNQPTDILAYLRSYLKEVAESFSSLKSLDIANEADFFKLHLALEGLDPHTRQLFEAKQQGKEFPSYDSLVEFIQQRCQILELSTPTAASHSTGRSRDSPRGRVLTTTNTKSTNFLSQPRDLQRRYTCPMCKGNHLLFRCYAFKQMPSQQKMDFARQNQVCFNCLRTGHVAPKCQSTFSCSVCKRRHHSMLHTTETTAPPTTSVQVTTGSQPPSASTSEDVTNSPSTGLIAAADNSQTVLLGTAEAYISDWKGQPQLVRLVIDSGSQFSIMTTECANRLGLRWSPIKRNLSGIGCSQPPPAKGAVVCKIRPINDKITEVSTRALVMSSITTNLPSVSLNSSACQYFQSVQLADSRFWDSRPIEFLLGSDLFLSILLPEEPLKVSENFGTLSTIFGHVVIGTPPVCKEAVNSSCLALIETPLSNEMLQQFWQIEEALPEKHSHPEDIICEEHFKRNVTRLPTGRYMVALPMRDPEQTYPSSRSLAMSRFRKLEWKLDRNESLKEKYEEFMEEYAELQHMKIATTNSSYVIPHHAVIKRELSQVDQCKVRVVFDASMRTATGSLNDNLLVGPKLQADITKIMLNFRAHRLVFCTDIVKMFRQILIRPEDRKFQHILWRSAPEDPIKTYELQTITYGLTSSPYLALRVLHQLVEDEGDNFPKAAKILVDDVYVDDVITGADTLEKALELKSELIALLRKGAFEVHKWASNSQEFLSSVQSDVVTSVNILPKDNTTKILGMLWDSASDSFHYEVNLMTDAVTKRTMLSVIARLYDPLGLLAPIIFLAKAILQELWALKLDWDDQPPEYVVKNWKDFASQLPEVNKIRLGRWIRPNVGTPTLFGFCDASQRGYAAALYLRTKDTDSVIYSALIKAKTRLAPVKTISIPRLELCGAYLLTKLLRSVSDFCRIYSITNIMLFTDSTIVLAWLNCTSSDLKTFEANRVGYILSYTHVKQWHHVRSEENPADIASRGVLTEALLENELWWTGPSWIRTSEINLPAMPAAVPNTRVNVNATSNTAALTVIGSRDSELHNALIEKYSSYRKLIAVTANLFRFKHNTLNSKEKKIGPLNLQELEKATSYIIKTTQQHHFSSDFDFYSNTNRTNRFKALAIFLDETGLLRVGGRLTHAQVPFEQRHPIVLPHHAHFTRLLIDYVHLKNFHLGVAALQAYLQRRYYIFQIKSLIRKRIWQCQRCFRARAKSTNPFMADLPLSRVTQGRPFLSVGVDFAGPFFIKLSTRRNAPSTKAYLCVFVCMAVKAVHLEVVSALNTEAFLAAFDRFIARRGLPKDVYSDCGLNFVGAARHLKELYSWYYDTITRHDITDHTTSLNINWHFNPPYSPHFGGLWEAAVKAAKNHLRRTVGDRQFYFEELTTLFTRIEAVLNSRPLCPTSAQPHSFDYLTPGHFLIGSALLAPPEQDIKEANLNRLTRWQLIQNSVQVFWKRWAKEYLHTLQARPKWIQQTKPLKIDDLVIIQDTNSAPLKWRLGRVAELHPGQDGVARVATVRTPNSLLKRAIHHLAKLPQEE